MNQSVAVDVIEFLTAEITTINNFKNQITNKLAINYDIKVML